MAGLQRSSGTFRRSGSSGMVWEDNKFLSGELKAPPPGDSAKAGDAAAVGVERSRSGAGHDGYRAGRVAPAQDPPSPRVAVCGFCNFFGKDKHKDKAGANAKARRR